MNDPHVYSKFHMWLPRLVEKLDLFQLMSACVNLPLRPAPLVAELTVVQDLRMVRSKRVLFALLGPFRNPRKANNDKDHQAPRSSGNECPASQKSRRYHQKSLQHSMSPSLRHYWLLTKPLHLKLKRIVLVSPPNNQFSAIEYCTEISGRANGLCSITTRRSACIV